MAVQALGLCRFSYLGEGGYQTSQDTLEERRRHLYDERNLARRFRWFEHLCLPSWAAQTDPDYRLVLLTGTDFPAEWLGRLRDLVSPLPQIVIEQRPPGPHRQVCREVFRRHVNRRADVIAAFRHDDDDAVALDYIARAKADFRTLAAPLFAANPLVALDYSRGFLIGEVDGQFRCLPRLVHCLGIALTLYMPPGHRRSPLDYGHHRLSSFMPGLWLQDSVMYLRGMHPLNDSGGSPRIGQPFDLPEAAHAEVIRERFAINLETLPARLAG
jgi:hypothetical protein